MGEQITHTQPIFDVSEDSSDIDVDEEEMTQSSESVEKETSHQQIRRSKRIQKPNLKYATAAIVEDRVNESETYEEASQNTAWQKAMEEEIIALEHNQSWELVLRLGDVKPISCRWVYKIKRQPDGSIERYKARLVA